MRRNFGSSAAAFFLISGFCSAARLSPDAERTFENYAASFESRLANRHTRPGSCVAVLDLSPTQRAEAERQLLAGASKTEPVNGGTWRIRDGLLHHWRVAAFVPGSTPQQMLALLREYNHFAEYYAPDVESSHAVEDRGQFATVAMRLKEQKIITVAFDAEYAIETGRNQNCGYSISRSKHIWQIVQPGTAEEHRLPEGQDDGFLWRLNSYWSFLQIRGGLVIECEAISLTRDIPAGLGWLFTPIVEDVPKESLQFTLNATRNALAARISAGERQ